MFKKIFGLGAIVIALAMVAFTTPKNVQRVDDVYFQFNPAVSATEANLEIESNWIETDNEAPCTIEDQKHCVVGVPNSMAVAGSPRTLSSAANLDATRYLLTSNYYIASGAFGVNRYNTKQP